MQTDKTITVGGLSFKNQTALKKYATQLTKDIHADPYLADLHHDFLLGLLSRHHEAFEKIGPGVASFGTRKHMSYGTVGLCLTRVDGTVDDFSLAYCVAPVEPVERAKRNFSRATRYAVLADIRKFRDTALIGAPVCVISGEHLTRDNSHVDHAPPATFAAIQTAYLTALNRGPESYEYHCDDLGRCNFSPVIAASFRTFHNEKAHLRLISASANLSGGSWTK